MARRMLDTSAMIRAGLVAVVLAVTASAASAGTYLGLGVGTSADLGGGMGRFTTDNGRSDRLIVGYRFGRLSIDGSGTRFGLLNQGRYDGTELAAALKLDVPVAGQLGVFARGGVERTWLSSQSTQPSLSGDGYILGAGLEYRLDLLLGAGSIFLDYNRSDTNYQVDNTMQKVDGTTSMWTLGLTLQI